MSFVLARYAERIGRRRAYIVLLAVMGPAGAVFAFTGWLPALVLAALTGTVSTDAVESGPITSLEQAMLPHATRSRPDAAVRHVQHGRDAGRGAGGTRGGRADAAPHRLVALAARLPRRGGAVRAGRGRDLAGTGAGWTSSPARPRYTARAGSSTDSRRCSRSTRSAAASSSRRFIAYLVLAKVRRLDRDARARLLLRRDPPGDLIPGGRAARRADRPRCRRWSSRICRRTCCSP